MPDRVASLIHRMSILGLFGNHLHKIHPWICRFRVLTTFIFFYFTLCQKGPLKLDRTSDIGFKQPLTQNPPFTKYWTDERFVILNERLSELTTFIAFLTKPCVENDH